MVAGVGALALACGPVASRPPAPVVAPVAAPPTAQPVAAPAPATDTTAARLQGTWRSGADPTRTLTFEDGHMFWSKNGEQDMPSQSFEIGNGPPDEGGKPDPHGRTIWFSNGDDYTPIAIEGLTADTLTLGATKYARVP